MQLLMVLLQKSRLSWSKINENQNLFTIVDLNNAWVDANLKENQLKNLKAGQAVEIISDVNKNIMKV